MLNFVTVKRVKLHYLQVGVREFKLEVNSEGLKGHYMRSVTQKVIIENSEEVYPEFIIV